MDVARQRRREQYGRLLGRATAALVSSQGYEHAVADVVAAVVPGFAAACAVQLVDGDGTRTIASAGDAGLLAEPQQVLAVVNSTAPCADPRLIVVRLRAGGRVFGVMTFAACSALEVFDDRDRILATLLADHVALAIGGEPGDPLETLRGRRVLAVDDDESTQDLVATMLLMYGVSVRTAGRAGQAIDILSSWRPDVLLADLAMPGEDGYALVRRVRAMPPPLGAIPAVALTAYTDPQSVQNAFAAGFDAHLGKPLEPHVLADALSKVLRKTQ